MSKQYETGHAKNVANLQKLIEQLTVYVSYSPAVPALELPNLQLLYENAILALNKTEEKRNANKNAIYIRQEYFKILKKTCTRIVSHLEILGLPKGIMEQAKSINKSIQGNSKKVKSTNSTPPNTISTSRQSYTQQATNFGILLQLLGTIPSYNPNLNELKLTTLTTYYNNMMTSIQAVDKSEAEFNNQIIERNRILYDEETGLYSIAQNTKKYVKSVYGAISPEYFNVSKIKFTTYTM